MKNVLFYVLATIPPFTTSTPSVTTTPMTTITPKPCLPPKVPTVCSPMCEEKCHFLGKCDTIIGMENTLCLPGCQCPNGTVWNGTTCVVREQCPCKDEDGNLRPVNTKRKLFLKIL